MYSRQATKSKQKNWYEQLFFTDKKTYLNLPVKARTTRIIFEDNIFNTRRSIDICLPSTE